MIKTVNVLQRGYKTPLQNEEEKTSPTFEQIDREYARTAQNGLYLVHDGTDITMDDLLQAVTSSKSTMSGNGVAIDLEAFLKQRKMERNYDTCA